MGVILAANLINLVYLIVVQIKDFIAKRKERKAALKQK